MPPVRKDWIVYVGNFELPDLNAAATRVTSNAKILRDLGYTVTLIGVRRGLSSSTLVREDHEGFECWHAPYPETVATQCRHLISARVKNFLESEDRVPKAVIFYNYPALAFLRCAAFLKRRDVKVLSDTTEWYDFSAGSILFRIAKLIDTSVRMHVCNPLSDGLITTSQYLTQRYRKYDRVPLELPTLFDTNQIPPPEFQPERAFTSYIYVGVPFNPDRVSRNRANVKERLDKVIEVFATLWRHGEKFTFDIFGLELREYLKVYPEHGDLISRMSEHIGFWGRQPNRFVRMRLSQADFSIFFRDDSRLTRSGFPTKLAESISCGTPVITNRMVSIERYAPTPGLLLCEPGEEERVVLAAQAMSRSEIDRLKSAAYESKAFDFSRFSEDSRKFLARVSIDDGSVS